MHEQEEESGPTDTHDLILRGKIVTPGLIDLHAHVYRGGTSIGVDAVDLARRSATATFVDAGTAGAGNLPGFREIDRLNTRQEQPCPTPP